MNKLFKHGNAYMSQIVWAIKMTLAYRTHIIVPQMVLVRLAIRYPPPAITATVAHNPMTRVIVVLYQLITGGAVESTDIANVVTS
jgi:hypothetical protein